MLTPFSPEVSRTSRAELSHSLFCLCSVRVSVRLSVSGFLAGFPPPPSTRLLVLLLLLLFHLLLLFLNSAGSARPPRATRTERLATLLPAVLMLRLHPDAAASAGESRGGTRASLSLSVSN